MREPFDDERFREARSYAERALSGFDTLHIGPLDYNVTITVDYLRTAAKVLEDFERETRRG